MGIWLIYHEISRLGRVLLLRIDSALDQARNIEREKSCRLMNVSQRFV